MSGNRVLMVAAAGAVLATASTVQAAPRTDVLRPDPTRERLAGPAAGRLSIPGDRAVWAHPLRRAAIRRAPAAGARPVDRLHPLTENGFSEVYPVLGARRRGDRWWARIRIPGRPNGRTGWVPRGALGAFRVVATALEVDRRTLRATFRRGGRVVWAAPVGVGRPGLDTPAGFFWIREGFPVRPGTLYGVYAFGTSGYSRLTDWPGGGVIGIHGTNKPWLLPGRPSHGCIRLRNRDIRWLANHMPIGTPVRVR